MRELRLSKGKAVAQGHTVRSQGSQDSKPDSVGQSHVPEGAYGLARRHRHDTGKGKGELWHMLSVGSYFGDQRRLLGPKGQLEF